MKASMQIAEFNARINHELIYGMISNMRDLMNVMVGWHPSQRWWAVAEPKWKLKKHEKKKNRFRWRRRKCKLFRPTYFGKDAIYQYTVKMIEINANQLSVILHTPKNKCVHYPHNTRIHIVDSKMCTHICSCPLFFERTQRRRGQIGSIRESVERVFFPYLCECV